MTTKELADMIELMDKLDEISLSTSKEYSRFITAVTKNLRPNEEQEEKLDQAYLQLLRAMVEGK